MKGQFQSDLHVMEDEIVDVRATCITQTTAYTEVRL